MAKVTVAGDCWHEETDDTMLAKKMVGMVNHLKNNDLSALRAEQLHRYRLYTASTDISGVNPSPFEGKRFNLVASMVDTGVSIMAASETLPYAQTKGADWGTRRKAIKLSRTLQSQFFSTKLLAESREVIKDACICGIGVLRFFQDSDEKGAIPKCERVFPLNLIYDPQAARYGVPRDMFEVMVVHKDVLASMYNVPTEVLAKANAPLHDDIILDQTIPGSSKSDLVVVYKGWHLPSSPTAKDGVHAVAIDGYLLHRSEWKETRHPFAILRGWAKKPLGLAGECITERVEEGQIRIDEMIKFYTKCQDLISTPKIFIHANAQVTVQPEQISDLPGQIIKYATEAPQLVQWSGTLPDLVQEVERIREQVQSQLGFTSQAIQGQKPEGLNSGAALRAIDDIAGRRHAHHLRHLEEYYLEAAECLIDLNNRCASEDPEFEISAKGRKNWQERTKWAELVLSTEDASISVLPVSKLVGTPAAQLQTVSEWIQAGLVDAPTARGLIAGSADYEGFQEDQDIDVIVAYDLVEDVLDGKRVALDPFVPVDVYLDIVLRSYKKAKSDGASIQVLDEFRRLLGILKGKVEQLQQAQAAQQAQMPKPLPEGPQLNLPGAAQ